METYTITTSGSHSLKWRYRKDSSEDGGEDRGWVDFVQWTGRSPVQDPDNWNTITYKYDPSGRRIEKNIDGYKTTYIWRFRMKIPVGAWVSSFTVIISDFPPGNLLP